MTDFAHPQTASVDPVGDAMSVALAAIFELRKTDNDAARKIASRYEEIAAQHTSGLLGESETVVALARLTDEVGGIEADSQARTA